MLKRIMNPFEEATDILIILTPRGKRFSKVPPEDAIETLYPFFKSAFDKLSTSISAPPMLKELNINS